MSRCHRAAMHIWEIGMDAGLHVGLHACVIGDGEVADREVTIDADLPVPVASLYKLPLALCWSDLIAGSRFDPVEELRLNPADRAPGGTGVAVLADPVSISQRDAVRLMLSVSDNAAAEAVLAIVGLTCVNEWCEQNDYQRTRLLRGSASSLRHLIDEVGGHSLEEAMTRLANPGEARSTTEYDSALTSHSSPKDLTAMLTKAWTAEQHGWVRESLVLQAWRHRIGSGFPHDDVLVAGKTGTLGRLRHEAAVVHFPGEHPVAVAVMTMSIRPEIHQPRVDSAIGAMARTAVNALRAPVRSPC